MDPSIILAKKVNEQMCDELIRLRLVESKMVDQAKTQMANHLEQGEIKNACLLKILTWDLKLLEEKRVLDYQIEKFNLGFCDITNFDIDRDELPEFKLRECWASMSLPIDFMSEVFFVATAHYLSSDVISHWETRLCRDIVWFVADLSSLALETLEREEQGQVEEKAAGESQGEKQNEGKTQEKDQEEKEEIKKVAT